MGNREDLLAAAKRLLYEKGYARITARDPTAASGVSLAAIGYHFGSKEALLNAARIEALGEWADELGRTLAAGSGSKGTPLERFEGIWAKVIESFATHRPLWTASFELLAQLDQARPRSAPPWPTPRSGPGWGWPRCSTTSTPPWTSARHGWSARST